MPSFNGIIATGGIENDVGAVIPPWFDNPVDYHSDQIGYDPVDVLSHGPFTNTQPIDEPRAPFNGVRIPGFFEDFYNRIHIEPPIIDAGNVSSDQIRTLTLFNGFFVPATLDAILESQTDGMVLSGITAPALIGPLVSRTLTLNISTEGPPDIDADYLFQFDIYQDLVLHISGSRIIVLPYQAISGFKETLESACEVLTMNDGTEQRIQHRQRPRQTFNGSYHVPSNEVGRADNILYGWLGKRWAIAVWSESQLVSFSSTDTIPCVTGNTDIRVGGLVMIWASESKYEVIEVAVINSGSIILTRPTVQDYPRAMLMPVRSGLAGESMKIIKSGTDAMVQAEFEVTDNALLASTAPAQYLGEDIYFDQMLMGDSGFTDEYRNRVDRVDFGTTIETYTPWKNRKIGRSVHYVFADRNESWTFRQWAHRRDGKQKPYWIPTFESNFILAMSGPVGTQLVVVGNDYRGLAEDRKHLAIELDDGTWRACAVTGTAVIDANTFSIAIDINLGVDATRLRRVSYLGLKRLDTNSVEIEWIGNAVGVADVPIVEIAP
jgi:hypothetical protein